MDKNGSLLGVAVGLAEFGQFLPPFSLLLDWGRLGFVLRLLLRVLGLLMLR
jgi:hypothetical protein